MVFNNKNTTMKIKYLFFFSLLLSLFSCSNEGPIDSEDTSCDKMEITNFSDIKAPSKGSVNNPLTFDLEITLNNGCGSFNNINEEINDNTITIEAYSKYQGCICNEIAPIEKVSYTFTPTKTGTYTFIFKSPNYDDVRLEVVIVE